MKKKTYPLFYAGKQRLYAASVVVGDFVFLSGRSGITVEAGRCASSDFAEQTRTAWMNIRSALEEAGTSVENIVKFVGYVRSKRPGDTYSKEIFEQVRLEFFKEYAPALIAEPPAHTYVEVPRLALDDMLVEIDVIAVMPNETRG